MHQFSAAMTPSLPDSGTKIDMYMHVLLLEIKFRKYRVKLEVQSSREHDNFEKKDCSE